jgi:hypothetical protein
MSYILTPIEEKACKAVDSAYKRNKEYWADDHRKMRRLLKLVMGSPIPEKPSEDGRSDIETATPWLIHQLKYSIFKNSLLSLTHNVRLYATKQTPPDGILWDTEMEEYLDKLISDPTMPIHKRLKHALFDLVATGNSVIRPYYLHDLKPIWDGKQDGEQLVYSGPDMPTVAPWDCYPTAGAVDTDQLHEVIFIESVYPHQLKAWAAQGLVSQEAVDEILKGYKEPNYEYGKAGSESKDPREQISGVESDKYGRIDIAIQWGLFPLYEGENYQDEQGNDKSKDEVECLIIKPVSKNICLKLDRNQYFHSKKEVIFAKEFDIPGQFWGECIFGLMEKMLIHERDWFNLLQDGANSEIARDRVYSDAIPPEQRNQKGFGRDYVIDKDVYKDLNGNIMHYVERGPSTLPEMYNQRDDIARRNQEISGIMDFLRGAGGEVPKTATEIQKLSASINVRFEQSAADIQASLMIPVLSWIISLLSSDEADDEYIAAQCGTPVNPFKQFNPMIPNLAYRIELEGTQRAVQNAAMQSELMQLLEIAKTIPPGPDDKGEMKEINLISMFESAVRLSRFKDPDKFEIPWVPPPVVTDPNAVPPKEGVSVPGQ